jgi:hypothetical protein
MKGKAREIKCKNCRHVIWYDDVDKVWHHKHMLHDDWCECRNPEPNLKTMKKQFLDEFEKIIEENHKNASRINASRGWNSLTVEEMFRPFTI